MNDLSATDSVLGILNRGQGKVSSVSKKQWLNQLEKEYLRERRQCHDESHANNDMKSGTAENSYQKKLLVEQSEFDLDSSTAVPVFGIEEQPIKKIDPQKKIDVKTLPISNHIVTNSNTHSNINLLVHSPSLDHIKMTNIQKGQLNNYFQKEQLYFSLNRSFGSNMTEDGLHVWLRDVQVDGEIPVKIVQRLREGLRLMGIDLFSVSVNGKTIWQQQQSLSEVASDNSDAGINKVY
ncbi:MAG: hypothetical protein RPU52_11990 [Candidatus Sedimenticola sp. (ex Thyasira tokunagai)]